jgi:DnaA family protein
MAGAAPVYLWGPSGSGKTHLLEAAAYQTEQRGGRAGWFDASCPAPWLVGEPWSLILFDDCDRFDAAQQQAAFGLFVEATSNGLPVLAAGRVPPVDLPLREDLRSRLGWGHVFHLQVLRESERRAVLRQAADARGVMLSDDVLDYMLHRFSRDLGSLMELLTQLDGYALQTQRAITVPLIRSMLESG